MTNAITHYQTSFRIQSTDSEIFMKVKANVYGWVLRKENDRILQEQKGDFFYRCQWENLFRTHSSIETNSLLSEDGDAWALRYTEIDKAYGRQRFWYTDIGVRMDGGEAVVSVRTSYARHTEDLSGERPEPEPTVPKVVRYLLRDHKAYSGRPEFRLTGTTLVIEEAGMGKVLASFITSPERRYPLIVFNGNGPGHMDEANRLALAVAGKSQVVVVATNEELGEELRYYLEQDYRVSFGFFRVYFPFGQRRNFPERHRWYDIGGTDYEAQREGIVHGLLRNHILQERLAVDSVWDINRLIAREKLIKLKAANPEQQKELEEFFKLHAEVEKERDDFKAEAGNYASEVDRLEEQVRQLDWRCKDYQGRLDAAGSGTGTDAGELFPTLPTNLLEVAKAAGRAFPRLVITENALKAAEDYHECKCLSEAWEILRHLADEMWNMKFKTDGQVDWERTFPEKTGYDLAMSEGKQTQGDAKLMRLRKVVHDGQEYDMTPHVKHGVFEPKLVRVHFAFDESRKKIVIGHIGRHIPNYTSKMM
jgi:hypothetical protein